MWIPLRVPNPTAMPQSTSAPVVATAEQRGAPFRPAPLAGSLKGSEILRIATEIRARLAAGERICNLTVGDFDPRQFRVPKLLEDGTVDALRKGETNYPPGIGMPPIADMDVHQTIVIAALPANSSAETT